jgi:hypothetical protein
MNNRHVLKLLQALSLTTASYSLLCILCKIFLCQSEVSILQDVTLKPQGKNGHKEASGKALFKPYFNLIAKPGNSPDLICIKNIQY